MTPPDAETDSKPIIIIYFIIPQKNFANTTIPFSCPDILLINSEILSTFAFEQ